MGPTPVTTAVVPAPVLPSGELIYFHSLAERYSSSWEVHRLEACSSPEEAWLSTVRQVPQLSLLSTVAAGQLSVPFQLLEEDRGLLDLLCRPMPRLQLETDSYVDAAFLVSAEQLVAFKYPRA